MLYTIDYDALFPVLAADNVSEERKVDLLQKVVQCYTNGIVIIEWSFHG
jgi:hypothetical protein